MSTVVCPAHVSPRRSHLTLGRRGEDTAVEHLRRLGLVVLSRNWRCREGELDIVATDGEILIVCEVKARTGHEFGAPEEAVTGDKIARIRRLASRWLTDHRVAWCPIRFDVLAVDYSGGGSPAVRHIVGAF